LESGQLRKILQGTPALEGLESALGQLEADGRAIEWEGRWYAAPKFDYAVGRLELLDDGDGQVKTQGPDGEERDFFIRRRNLKGASEGDRVLVKPLHKEGARPWRTSEGVIAKVLQVRLDTLVGTLTTDDRGYRWLDPFDRKLTLELEVQGAEEVPDGHYVVVTVERAKNRRTPVGRVVEVLGDLETPGVDVLVILRHYEIPDEFPPEVLMAAAALPADPQPQDWAGREDLRNQVAFTIDGETARDFDDAVSIERLPNGFFRLGVHIADVAHYVREGGVIDLEAYKRGTSVYYPDRAVPMLPERLSNGLCSLRPNVPRLTTSAFLDIDRNGQVHAARFAETVIQSFRRLTYTEVRRVLEEPQPGDAEEYGPVLPALREMHELMKILNRNRAERGSIDFDLPEGDVELDTNGVMVGVLPEERNVAHRLVEEFMIAANEAVALEMVQREAPALYRVHDAPSPARLEELRELLKTFGLSLRGDVETLHPGALQDVLKEVQGKPEEPFVSSVVLRTMQRALYDPENRGHYALASTHYLHFTSPIRRYPDLIVHRGLKALVNGRAESEAAKTYLAGRLPVMGEHTSKTEKRSEQSERDLLQWKKVRFLEDRIGEIFTGRVTGVQPFGLFVQLDEYYVDGLAPVRSLGEDFYRYEAESHRLIGERTGEVFQLADSVEVELVGVSPRHRGLDLKIVGTKRRQTASEGPWDPDRPRRKTRARQDSGQRKKAERGRKGR
jgi:ribonuclease R